MKKNRRSKIGSLRLALLELLEEHERDNALPTSARFLFYELVQRGILSKQRKTQGRRPNQNISDALTDLRERGDVPWDWIVDETRSLDDSQGRFGVETTSLTCDLAHVLFHSLPALGMAAAKAAVCQPGRRYPRWLG
jgi:HEAT repeat protein